MGPLNRGVYVLMSGLDIERLILSAGPLGLVPYITCNLTFLSHLVFHVFINHIFTYTLNCVTCSDVPLRNYSLTHLTLLTVLFLLIWDLYFSVSTVLLNFPGSFSSKLKPTKIAKLSHKCSLHSFMFSSVRLMSGTTRPAQLVNLASDFVQYFSTWPAV